MKAALLRSKKLARARAGTCKFEVIRLTLLTFVAVLGDFRGSRIIQTWSHEFCGVGHQHHCRGNSQKVSMRGGEGKGRGRTHKREKL